MKKTLCILTVIAGSVLCGAAPLMAQPASAEGSYFLNVSAGGQMQSSEFSSGSTFASFGETGQVQGIQTVGRAFVFDVSGGYHVTSRFGVGAGVWTSRADSAAAATVLTPNPLFFNRFTTTNLSAEDLKQSTVGVNLMILFRQPITDKIDVTFSAGPSIIRIKQQVASATIDPNSGTPVLTILDETKRTAKAGNVGLDLGYQITDKYGIGGFVRYVGAGAGLPSAPDLKIGGVQLGAGARLRF